jgi:two-component system cell cycle sensor histidine kinase/response regulator CckA
MTRTDAEVRYRALCNTVRDAILVADIDTGMIVDANLAAEALCGRSLAELQLLHHTELHPQEGADLARPRDEKEQVPCLTEGLVLQKDGQRIPVEIASSEFTGPDGRRMLLFVFRDTTERNVAREALRQSEERFQQVAQSAGEFIWEVDANGVFVYASPVVEQILGYKPDELVGKLHSYDLFAPETREETKAAALEVYSRRGPFQAFAHLNMRKDGRLVTLETSGLPIEDGNGNLRGYRGTDRDVTEHYQAEVMRSHLAAIVESCDDAIIGKTLDGTIVSWNAGAERLYGYKADEMVGQRTGLVIPPDRHNELSDIFARLRQGGHIEHFETQRIRKDGRQIDVALTVSPIRNGAGTVIGASTIARDITDRKRAEAALRESEQRFRATFFQAAVGIVQTNLDYQWLLVNDRFCEILGYSRAELTGKTFLDVTHPDDLEASLDTAHQLLAGEISSWSLEKRYIRKDGSTVWARLFTSLVRDEHNQPHYFISVIEDITDRKQAERALLESELRLAMAHGAAGLGVWDCDLRSNVITFYGEYARLFNLSPSQTSLTAVEWLRLVHPDDRERVQASLLESVKAAGTWDAEFRSLAPDGSVRWLHGKGAVFPDESGRSVRMSGVNFDITDRKHAEEALRQSEERFRLAVKATNDAIWDIDLVTGTVHWSETYTMLYGRPIETSNSWQWWIEHIHPEDRERAASGLRYAISDGESAWTCEYRFQRLDGGWAHIYDRAYIARDASGNPWRVIGAMQDLTERKRTEAALRESEESLKNAARLAHVGNWHRDIRANRMTWSEEMFRIFGQPQDHAPNNEEFLQAVIPQDRERVEREIRDCFAEKSTRLHSTEYRITRPDGDRRTLASISEAIPDEEGLPSHVFGACLDITDFRRAQEEAVARQKLETVGTLANGIAHDFNNLLGGVLAQAELALEQLATGSRPEQELEVIRDVAIRGSEIVRQLMIYAGQESEILLPVSISQIVEEMLDLVKVSVSKQARLEIDLGQDLPAVKANSAQISQIVMNLITNASEAIGDRDGVIRVSTRCVTVRRDSVGATPDRLPAGNYLKLEVSDTGYGMPLATQARVFDPFFSTKSAGRGLGLAVVQGIVRRLGGAIHLASEPGKGTTFEILLPCSEAAAGTASGLISRHREPSQVATVLVVEDEDPIRQAASKLLRKAGFSVIEASDGLAALDEIRAQKSPIDVLLLDITLPGAPSRQVFEEARRLRGELRVIVTSAYSEETAAASLQGSFEGFIRKPYQFADLADLIRQVLS